MPPTHSSAPTDSADPGSAAANTGGHRPRKRFGQNFLVDPHYIAKIVAAIAPAPGDRLVEIGPGQGAITAPLLARVPRMAAIEIDRDLASRLAARWSPEALDLHVADALEFDFAAIGTDLRIVGNLPYNISTPLLFHLSGYADRLVDIHVMLQREVVARMVAAPGTPDYGRLTVMLQAKFAVVRLFVVPPGAFRPVPAVDSAVVRLLPLGAAAPVIRDPGLFARVVAAAFGQRRKTLRNALGALYDEAALHDAGVNPAARGETLTVEDFARLSAALAARAQGERRAGSP